MLGEVEVGGSVERDEMDVCMRHVDSDHCHPYLDARADLFEAFSYGLAEEVQFDKKLIVNIEDIIDLFLGNTEDVAFGDGTDIEECKAVVSFCHFIAGNLACHYS